MPSEWFKYLILIKKSMLFFNILKLRNVEKHFYAAKILEHSVQKSSYYFRAGGYTTINDLRSQKILYNIFASRYTTPSI